METASASDIKAPALADQGQRRIEWALQEMPVLSGLMSVEEYRLADGRRLRLLAEGRLVNLAAAEGHPSAVMDMSFANQVLCAVYLASREQKLDERVYDVPADIDQEVARLKLAAMKITIDGLTAEQKDYLSSWEEGT